MQRISPAHPSKTTSDICPGPQPKPIGTRGETHPLKTSLCTTTPSPRCAARSRHSHYLCSVYHVWLGGKGQHCLAVYLLAQLPELTQRVASVNPQYVCCGFGGGEERSRQGSCKEELKRVYICRFLFFFKSPFQELRGKSGNTQCFPFN